MYAEDDEISILWSGIPSKYLGAPLVILDSPPDSPPQEGTRKALLPTTSGTVKPLRPTSSGTIKPLLPTTSGTVKPLRPTSSGTIKPLLPTPSGNVKPALLTTPSGTVKPLLPTPSTSSTFTFGFNNIDLTKFIPAEPPITPDDSDNQEIEAPPASKKKKKKKKKQKNKNPLLVEKMIEQIKEAGILEKNKLENEEKQKVTSHPRVKWTRYFEADGSHEKDKIQEEEEIPVTARDLRKAAEKAERLSRIQQGKIAKLSRNRRKPCRRIRCDNCQQWGHMKFECPDPIKPVKCHMCAGVGHTAEACPKSICLQCGARSYSYVSGCRNCNRMHSLSCVRCNSQGHEAGYCPDLWRRFYATVSGDGQKVSSSTKIGPNSLKPSHKLYCCTCAKRGHSVDKCPRATESAILCGFSYVSSNLGVEDYGKKEKKRMDLYQGAKVLKRFKRDLYN